eukprot:CAMPEP_0201876426 /NCGR_PEP_ID=MMETSP0902-20130614/8124_1 /ASSEMBLY_ACC=CAM_ASM_000551 /TAXON_ID=420261 /ORGANISM="Thalassiosira antarctica, Strain CCMP982" /LENGTH=64 /DNA_ID=CAMNT_0048403673 /DNA_START=82 /DNA_END=276 /DNA_ORIENTATION=-
MPAMPSAEEPLTPVQMVINGFKLLFAMSPLIALFYIVYTGFEPEEVEMKKRKQKGDFQLDGHSE